MGDSLGRRLVGEITTAGLEGDGEPELLRRFCERAVAEGVPSADIGDTLLNLREIQVPEFPSPKCARTADRSRGPHARRHVGRHRARVGATDRPPGGLG